MTVNAEFILKRFKSAFPIATWVTRYNLSWLIGDLIAGLTIGLIAIPQSLAYATIIGIPIQHGLYSAFIGVAIYFIFATSKDVTIGPSAVLVLTTAQTVAFYPSILAEIGIVPFVCALSFFSGCIEIAVGLLRFGFLVDFISEPTIAGFTTGAAIAAQVSQLPSLLGIVGITKSDSCYLVLYNTLSHFNLITYDAIVGMGTIIFLVAWKMIANWLEKVGKSWSSVFDILGNTVAIVLMTVISYGVNLGIPNSIRTFGYIPSGLNYIAVPSFASLGQIIPTSGVIALVAILDQVAVTRALARQNGYKTEPNQEIIALGIVNLVGSFFGAFPNTGSFSRSAVQSRSGVRTPAAGVFTAAVVLFSIYFLTGVFGQIPKACLAGVIFFNLTSLISSFSYLKALYTIDKLELLVFMISFWVLVFTDIQIGIYSSVAFSMAVMLYKICRPTVISLVARREGDSVKWIDGERNSDLLSGNLDVDGKYLVSEPPLGVAVFRLEESLTFSNASHVSSVIFKWILAYTTVTSDETSSMHEPLWCEDPDEVHSNSKLPPLWPQAAAKPHLLSVVLDFSCVANMDITGLQALIDTRKDLQRHFKSHVRFTFANVKQHLSGYFAEFEKVFDEANLCFPDIDSAILIRSRRTSYFVVSVINKE